MMHPDPKTRPSVDQLLSEVLASVEEKQHKELIRENELLKQKLLLLEKEINC